MYGSGKGNTCHSLIQQGKQSMNYSLIVSVRTLSRVEEKIGQQNNESQPFHEALIPREIIIPAKF